jgi:hypothetical protein
MIYSLCDGVSFDLWKRAYLSAFNLPFQHWSGDCRFHGNLLWDRLPTLRFSSRCLSLVVFHLGRGSARTRPPACAFVETLYSLLGTFSARDGSGLRGPGQWA